MNALRQNQRPQLPIQYRKAKRLTKQARAAVHFLPGELAVRLFLLLNELITFSDLIVENLDL